MAKNPLTNMPVDVSAEIAPGVVQREYDFFADNSPTRGFGVEMYAGRNGPGPVGTNKGNRSFALLPPRQTTIEGGPFGKLRSGR